PKRPVFGGHTGEKSDTGNPWAGGAGAACSIDPLTMPKPVCGSGCGSPCGIVCGPHAKVLTGQNVPGMVTGHPERVGGRQTGCVVRIEQCGGSVCGQSWTLGQFGGALSTGHCGGIVCGQSWTLGQFGGALSTGHCGGIVCGQS